MCSNIFKFAGLFLIILILFSTVSAQVYSPWVVKEDQPDTRDLAGLAEILYQNAGAETDREKAEAIWRYLLTDGRFVEPGVFYHIAGWAYEEPMGEVLDPIKLLNSYGFGLCYQIAPLLEALWEAGGFPDARTWFLTGHTVTEVFYDGKYNMLDSDMLGYTTIGSGDPRSCPIASVRQLEEDEKIILDKMLAPDKADPTQVSSPWYPADVRAKAMNGYAGVFSSKDDNWLFYYSRFPAGHSMDHTLRPGEKLIRYFEPESEGLFYLPFKRVDESLSEFPREVSNWRIRTEDGPHSQKDSRLWATGRIEYVPPLNLRRSYYPLLNQNLQLPSHRGESLKRRDPSLPAVAVFGMPTPYVLINADFQLSAALPTRAHLISVATSIDGGISWQQAGSVSGPFSGTWKTGPKVLAVSAHGVATAVSGRYGYLVRLTLSGPESGEIFLHDAKFSSTIQLNPRTLPALEAGENRLSLVPGIQRMRWDYPVDISRITEFAAGVKKIKYLEEDSNGFLLPVAANEEGEIIFEVSSPDGSALQSVNAGGRFLVLNRLGPEKRTAETRETGLRQDFRIAAGSLAWALSPEGPWTIVWKFRPPTDWLDKESVERLLLWPEVDREINSLPEKTEKVYLRYFLKGMALDDIRMAAFTAVDSVASPLLVSHHWYSRGSRMSHSVKVMEPAKPFDYQINTNPLAEVKNLSIVFECPADEQP